MVVFGLPLPNVFLAKWPTVSNSPLVFIFHLHIVENTQVPVDVFCFSPFFFFSLSWSFPSITLPPSYRFGRKTLFSPLLFESPPLEMRMALLLITLKMGERRSLSPFALSVRHSHTSGSLQIFTSAVVLLTRLWLRSNSFSLSTFPPRIDF